MFRSKFTLLLSNDPVNGKCPAELNRGVMTKTGLSFACAEAFEMKKIIKSQLR